MQAYQPPPLLPQEPPASTARSVRSARWLLALTGVLVLAVAGAAILGWNQAHRLASTRTQLATLRASAASEQAQVSALAGAVTAQQQSVASLGTQLGATQTQLATTQSKLGTTQSQLQTAQTRSAPTSSS